MMFLQSSKIYKFTLDWQNNETILINPISCEDINGNRGYLCKVIGNSYKGKSTIHINLDQDGWRIKYYMPYSKLMEELL